jgi:L-arabinokinase
MTILWHVSSHGWGHAARQRELIRVYRQRSPGTLITVASDVPRWFWDRSEIDSIIPGSPSPVVLEKDGSIHTEATLVHYRNFLKNSTGYLKSEVLKQQRIKPDLIVTDIDPLPVKAAEATGIPALGIGNFTWDWIMKKMFPGMAGEADRIAAMYSHGTYLKLPMGPGHSPFLSTVDTPLLRGGPPGHPERAVSLLPPGKCCLIALRETPSGVSLTLPDGVSAVSSLPEPVHRNCFNITPSALSSAGATFADLVAACDLLISKPGYGIISQILAMGKKSVLLTGRQFPEERYLLSAIREKPGILLFETQGSFSLQDAVANLLQQKNPPASASEGAGFITSVMGAVG